MRKRTFHLTAPEANALQAAYLHCQEANTKTRYQAVRLYGRGYPVPEILDICGCSHTSLLEWSRAYRKGGAPALVDQRAGGNRARVTPMQIEEIQATLHRYTPAQLLGPDACQGDGQFWRVAEVATLLRRDYGGVYQSDTSYRNLLTKCDFSYQKPSKQYKSRSPFKVMEFEEQLEKKRSIRL